MSQAGPEWHPCRAIVTHDDGSARIDDDTAEIEIAAGGLLLVYFDERGAVVLQGREEAPGRFACRARSRPRMARLTRAGRVLEGRWHEGDETGSLRIELESEPGPGKGPGRGDAT